MKSKGLLIVFFFYLKKIKHVQNQMLHTTFPVFLGLLSELFFFFFFKRSTFGSRFCRVQNISTLPFFCLLASLFFWSCRLLWCRVFSKLPSSRVSPNITFAAVVQFSPSLITAICCTCPSFLSALPLPGVPVYSGTVLQVVFCCLSVCCLIDWLLDSFFCTPLWRF